VQAIASAVQDTGPATDYSRFYAAVAQAQLTQWLAELAPTEPIVDISGPAARAAEVAVNTGHTVLRVVEPGAPAPAVTGYGADGPRAVIADGNGPGGLVLACVDSLNRGMAVLAEQHRWPHLIDVPNADVVLVPWPDGSITRCYGAEHLRELFTGSGLEVNWIRPRTVFSPRTVSYLLARYKRSFDRLVAAELGARCDDSVGAQLVVCAAKRSASAPIAL